MNKTICLMTAVAMIAAVGCDSKRIEKRPDDVPGAQGTLAETKSYSIKMNSEIGKMKFFIRKVSALVRAVEIALNPNLSTSNKYTLIDTFIDVLDESEKGISMVNSHGFSRKSHFEISALKDDNRCKKVEMLVEGTKDENNDVGEIALSIHTCSSEGPAFEPVLTARYNEQKEIFAAVNLRPLQNVFHDAGRSIAEKDLKCEMTSKNKDTLNGLNCRNIRIPLSKDENDQDLEYALIDNLTYRSDSEVVYSVVGAIYEKYVKKANFQIHLDKNGKPIQEPSIVRVEPK